jgi:hypothetical protein
MKRSPVKSSPPPAVVPAEVSQDNGVQKRRAATVLEVLAGVRTPSQAASALSLSLGAYYKLEQRALRGLVEGCQSVERGRKVCLKSEMAKLESRCDRISQELQRYQALARAAQRAVGLPEPPAGGNGRRRGRRPMVRALKAAESLRTEAPAEAPTAQKP